MKATHHKAHRNDEGENIRLTYFTDLPSVKRDGKNIAREVSDATYCLEPMCIVDNEDDQNLLSMTEDACLSKHPLRTYGRISDLEGIASDKDYPFPDGRRGTFKQLLARNVFK